MLTDMKSILADAKKKSYGVAAPNAWNEDSIRAAIRTAEREKAPIIIALYPVMADIFEFGKIAVELAKNASVPVAVHLDHGQELEQVVKAIRAGFTSVMVDRSTLPFDKNVEAVKEIVTFAHAVGVTVEAELGHVGQGCDYTETKDQGLTDPKEAIQFVEMTGVDCLAVAVGTSHGVYKGKPELQFDLLSRLNHAVDVPLVLHGCSGTGDGNLKKAIGYGITKLNLYTDLDMAGYTLFQESIKAKEISKITEACNLMFKGYSDKLAHYIQWFGASGRA
ncbi:class II fructose-bisphosphate aldolase [Pelosinus propionicus]|uniref:Fructose-bisphosphate aldolase, class II n=1 Tax=Pelosinus propionicus DSM 13327 TaxID=1123291 RepID=A0A1I4I959_9FIRM|nr:class II fructose-bisphosphate aldolase [Pelosinus propionicus]SFL50948.1 fructose-bisphosphate aldolase, class II [Pelosinus propionicus DSM 13327]